MAPIYLREARLQRGLTQQEVAARLGVSQRSISNWETGFTAPTPKLALSLAKLLKLDPNMIPIDRRMVSNLGVKELMIQQLEGCVIALEREIHELRRTLEQLKQM